MTAENRSRKVAGKQARDSHSRDRFLDAAEYHFAEYGYEGAKIRAIADRSEVNLGALHHYWGSKEELFRAVCERRLVPMNDVRLKRFDQLEAASGGQAVDKRELLRAAIEPTFFLDDLEGDEQRVFRKFYGRAITEPSPVVGQVMRSIFTGVSTRFFSLLRDSCRHLSDDEFFWRANCIFGAFVYAPAFIDRIAYYAHPDFDVEDSEHGISQMVEFLAAGMEASSLQPSL